MLEILGLKVDIAFNGLLLSAAINMLALVLV
jgi:hypothetical protein